MELQSLTPAALSHLVLNNLSKKPHKLAEELLRVYSQLVQSLLCQVFAGSTSSKHRQYATSLVQKTIQLGSNGQQVGLHNLCVKSGNLI